MKMFLGLSILVFSQISYAIPRNVEIDSRLYFNGQRIGAPRILAEYGEKSKVFMSDLQQNREFNLEVTPVRMANEQVKLRYTLAIKEDKNEIISRGYVDLKNKKGGTIYLDKGKVEIHLKIKNS